MKKYQVIVRFEMNEDFMLLVPPHRTYIGFLVNKGIVDSYYVSMESQTVWMTVTAKSRKEVEKHISKSPLYKYWTYTIEELMVYDGQLYRLPVVQLN